MNRRAPLLAAVATITCLVGFGESVDAHIVYARPTLLSLVGGAELAVHATVLDPHAILTLEATGERRPIVRVELREVFKGKGEPGQELRFASHGHGVVEYAAGEEVLAFLVPLARSKELAALQAADLEWVSLQGDDARYLLAPANREGVLAAVRGYAAAGRLSDPAARIESLRGVTLDLLTSGNSQLAASAVRDLVATGDALVTAADVPRLLEQVVRSAKAAIGVRLGLLVELERRGLVAGAPLWEDLLHTTPKPDLLQVVRVAGRHPSPRVNATLVEMLGQDDELAEAATLALGDPSHHGAVPALSKALQSDASRVRMGAIRALGRIGTPAARKVLEVAARDHEDAATRRRAAAEVRSLTAGR
jgi:hypothetical protein